MCEACEFWNSTLVPRSNATVDYYADVLGVRVGGIVEYVIEQDEPFYNGSHSNQTYSVTVIVDETDTLTFS
jgi:hypothetical protein